MPPTGRVRMESRTKSGKQRQPPVRIPIPFEQFVEGVLKIDPAKLRATRKKAAKRRAVKAKKRG
jgi:hypothetical protein